MSNNGTRTGRWLGIAWAVVWLTSGCGKATPTPNLATLTPAQASDTPEIAPTPTSIHADQIEQAQEKWVSLQIASYEIEIEYYEAYNVGLQTKRDVTVQGGRVTASSCAEDNCPAFVLADVYTVDDLFRVATGRTVANGSDIFDECLEELSFDETYGFPNYVSFDCPRSSDEEHWVRVLEFKANP